MTESMWVTKPLPNLGGSRGLGVFPVDPLAMCPHCGMRWGVHEMPEFLRDEKSVILYCDPKHGGCRGHFELVQR